MLLTLAMNQYVLGALMVVFLVICALVILTILVQRPQGGGLAGAFGGGSGSGQTAFGTKTGDALTVLTISMFVVYLAGAIVLGFGTRAAVHPAQTTISAPGSPDSIPATQPGTAPAGTAPAPATDVPANQAPAGTAPAGPTPAGSTAAPGTTAPGSGATPAPATVPPAPTPTPPATTPSPDPATAPK